MDTRTALKKNERLLFPGMECVIDAPAGRGANVLAYIGHYKDLQHKHLTHTVLIRELFPYDPMGRIFRGEDGNLHVPPSARDYYDWHRMTFLRGNEVHLRLSGQIPSKIDLNINTFSCRGTLYSLLGYTGGRNLEEEIGPEGLLSAEESTAYKGISSGIQENVHGFFSGSGNVFTTGDPVPDSVERNSVEKNSVEKSSVEKSSVERSSVERSFKRNYNQSYPPVMSPADRRAASSGLLRIIRVMQGALEVLRAFHDEGYLHLDISPDNILLIGEPDTERVTLIDYNSVHTLEEIRGIQGNGGQNGSENISENTPAGYREDEVPLKVPAGCREDEISLKVPAGCREDRLCLPPVDLSTKEGYTSPEVRLCRFESIGPHSDLYSMTAVFWHCLSGKRLEGLSFVGAVLPDPGELPRWRDLSEPVLSMLRRILRKGLISSPRRRYQSANELLTDLAELEDRITGRGITRWSLWESGRVRLLSLMQENTGLQYIRDESCLYPIKVQQEDGSRIDFRHMDAGGQESPVLLLGGGGMGKTTVLYRIAHDAYTGDRRFSEDATAVFYISLYGYRDGGDHFLRDSVLEGLQFKPQTDSMETARRELMQLLDCKSGPGCPALPENVKADSTQSESPEADNPEAENPEAKSVQKTGAESFQKKRNVKPVLLLLLDGLNEASGETGPLLHEIRLLASKPGVQLLLTSRSDPGDPFFTKNILCRLDSSDVRKILSREGLLPPENMELMDLLCFPILLSVYIETVKSGGTGARRMNSREELLDQYFLALRKKETRDLTDPGITVEGVDAVLRFLLPEIAARIRQSGKSLTDRDLLTVVEKCYRELSGRTLTEIYPEWIGHSRDLRLGTRTADEWYGRAVLDILWRRTGLLVRDEKGCFRIQHQIFEDYLASKSREFHQIFDHIKKRQRNWCILAAVSLVLVLTTLFSVYNYRMRLEITRKHEQMILAEAERNTLEYISQSQEALEKGDRREAVRCAADALLLQYADLQLTEAALLEEDGIGLLRESLPALRKRLLSGSVAIQPEGEYAAAAQRALTDALGVYDLPDTFKSDYLLELPSLPEDFVLSPEGTRLCAVCSRQILIYGMDSGEEVLALPLSASRTEQAVFLNEDTIVYTDSDAICVYDLTHDHIVWTAPCAGRLALSADRKRIAAVTPDKTAARIYNAADGKEVAAVSFGKRRVSFGGRYPKSQPKASGQTSSSGPGSSLFVLNRDGSLLAVSFEDGSISCFDAAGGKSYDLPGLPAGACYEGGFCRDILAWSVRYGEKSVCFAADTSSLKPAYRASDFSRDAEQAGSGAQSADSTPDMSIGTMDCFSSDHGCLLKADDDGILVSDQNILYSWHPEKNTGTGSRHKVFSGHTVDPDTVPDRQDDHCLDIIAEAAVSGADSLVSICRTQNCLAAGTEAGHYSFFTKSSIESGSADETEKWHKNISSSLACRCDYIAIAGDRAMCASMDSLYVQILRKNTPVVSEFFSYDSSYPHTEARLSADRSTIVLYSASGLRVWSAEDGRTVGQASFPRDEEVHDLRFCREDGESLLQVTWNDGTICCYSAADGSLLSRSKTDPPVEAPYKEFLTDRYRIVCPPQEPFTIYDRLNGEDLGGYYEDGALVSIDQADTCILATYIVPGEDDRLGILFNDSFDSLACIPDICDTLDGDLIVDCRDGRLCSFRIRSLPQLLEQAEPCLKESF